PHIDALAAESVDFTNMIASMPVCAASRASLLTGKYTTSTGMVINEIRMNTSHRCLAVCLNDAGYETSYIGKWHLYANELGNHYDPKNSYVPPGPDRLGFDGYWAAYNFHHEYYGEAAYYHLNTPEKVFFPEGTYEPDGQTDLAIKRLREHSKQEAPFYLQLNFGPPHLPWREENVPEHWMKEFRDMDFPLPPNYSTVKDPHGDDWSNEDHDPEKIQDWKRVYYAQTSSIDENIGRLRAALSELNLDENTIFIFTSDHGEMFGAQGRVMKNIFYEEASRIPFLLRMPTKDDGANTAPEKIDACTSYVDVMPTLLGLIGTEIPREVEGMDVSHLIRGEDGPEPEFAFLQNTGACAAWENGHEWRALRNKQYTYAVFKSDGQELLFDNQNDPFQTKNLANDRDHKETFNRFRKVLREKMVSLNDTFEDSLYYKDHWISKDRIILRSATIDGS
ncbi:MAG: sulfatase, partial [Spirochaetales bacterium]|nr:sulfatase [Spirochaetales bacterium]